MSKAKPLRQAQGRPFIGVVDYGRGNLRSVAKAFEHVGAKVKVGASPKALRGAAGVVLPGVGAFGDAMAALKRRRFTGWLAEQREEGTPLLGVCLGLQLFCASSSEFGRHQGLGFFPLKVSRLGAGQKVPHMGWAPLRFDKACPLFKGLRQGAPFYFLHSYRAPARGKGISATARSGREAFGAALWEGQVFATQFHPEKSQADGLRIYKNFWDLCRRRAA